MIKRYKKNDEELKGMSLGQHLEELRARLIITIAALLVCVVICMLFGKFFIRILTAPFNNALGLPQGNPTIQTITPTEGFMVYMKISLFFAMLFASPVIFWQLWSFISPGLYKSERKFVYIVAPICATLFTAGALLFLLVIATPTMKFLILFNKSMSLASNWTFESYTSLVISLTLIFGASFQLPVAIVFAERIGLVSVETLARSRRYVILGIVVVAAGVTPTSDPFSLLALSIPLCLLFEGALVACRILRRRNPTQTQ